MFQFAKERTLRFINDESGPTAVEYAVMLALILTVCIAAIGFMGVTNSNSWSNTSTEIDGAFNTN